MSSQTCTANNVLRSRHSAAVEFRRAITFIPTGVAVLFADEVWMTVSSLHCISFDPPMISVALSRESRKSALILASGRFHVRLLRSGEEALAKGEGTACGAGLMEMDCAIAAIHPVGDHDVVLAQVSNVAISDGYPVVYWRRGLHALHPQYDFITSPDALDKFVAAWEAGSLTKTCWNHAGHVAVGAHYAVRYPSNAFERTKSGILRYNQAVGTENSDVSGYHETLTRFWAEVLARFVKGIADPFEAAVKAVHKFGEDRDLHHLYYSFDVVRSTEARRAWIPPDLDGPY